MLERVKKYIENIKYIQIKNYFNKNEKVKFSHIVLFSFCLGFIRWLIWWTNKKKELNIKKKELNMKKRGDYTKVKAYNWCDLNQYNKKKCRNKNIRKIIIIRKKNKYKSNNILIK